MFFSDSVGAATGFEGELEFRDVAMEPEIGSSSRPNLSRFSSTDERRVSS